MLKRIFFFLLGITFLNCTHLKADDEDIEQNSSSHTLSRSPFGILPPEMIQEIGGHLYGDDFSHFASTCSYIRTVLFSIKSLFMPEPEEEAQKAVEECPFQKIPHLTLVWGRGRKSVVIPTLKRMLTNFETLVPSEELSTLDPHKTRFRNYIKVLNLLCGIGYEETKKTYQAVYISTQESLGEAIGEDEDNMRSPILYTFYFECFALLNPEISSSLVQKYREGVAPFSKDLQKAEEYSSMPQFLLSPEVFNCKEVTVE